MNSCWGCRRGITKCRQGLRYWRHRPVFPPAHTSLSSLDLWPVCQRSPLSPHSLSTCLSHYFQPLRSKRATCEAQGSIVGCHHVRASHTPGGAADRNTFPKTAEMSCYFGLMVPEGEIEGRERAKETGRGFHVLCHTFRDQAWVSQLEKQSDSLTRIPSYFCH